MALASTLEIGEGGVMADDADELESKLPVDDDEPPRDEIGRMDELDSLFWQL